MDLISIVKIQFNHKQIDIHLLALLKLATSSVLWTALIGDNARLKPGQRQAPIETYHMHTSQLGYQAEAPLNSSMKLLT